MGKTLSKAGMRLNTRRQRSQVISQHQGRLTQGNVSDMLSTATGPTVAARVLDSDRTILNLKIQKTELSIYKARLAELLRKEMAILTQLLVDGKRDAAQLLLKKKRFQQYLLDESEAELDSILGKASNNPQAYQNIKAEAENCINRNSETLKKIQMLLALDDIEQILDDNEAGEQKQQEVQRMLLLATVGERKKFDAGLDLELNSILAAVNDQEQNEKSPVVTESQILEAAAAEGERDLIDLEDYVNDYGHANPRPPQLGSDGSAGTSAAEDETDGGYMEGDDTESGIASNNENITSGSSTSQVSSNVFPEVPEDVISDAYHIQSETEVETA